MDSETEKWMAGHDNGRAHPARVYDYLVGGTKYNLPPDRQVAEQAKLAVPHVRRQAVANRSFLGRAVRDLVDRGTRQFLDIGSGIPATGNVHEVAQDVASDANVVYVDIDPVAVMTANQILDGNDQAIALQGDLAVPESIVDQLEQPEVRSVIDLDRPVALLLVAVLHFVPDSAKPYEAVAKLRERLAPGSYLVISHGATEAFSLREIEQAQEAYRKRGAQVPTARTREQVTEFFGDFRPVPPGVVWLPEWLPGAELPDFHDDPVRSGSHVGVARKL
jgi:hypothetical protein